MSYRQQRTLSRRIIDTGQQPVGLPILIQPVISVDSVFGNFTLVFPIPVRVLGVPAYTSGDGGTCNGANLSTDTEVLLSFIGPASPGNVLDIPAWDPAIRGLEGEWVAGGR